MGTMPRVVDHVYGEVKAYDLIRQMWTDYMENENGIINAQEDKLALGCRMRLIKI